MQKKKTTSESKRKLEPEMQLYFIKLLVFSNCYIERCFAIVCEKDNLKNLNFT